LVLSERTSLERGSNADDTRVSRPIIGSSVRILYPRGLITLGQIPKVRKDGLLEYLCIYMPTVVSSGSSVKILYPRESFDSWEDPEGPVRIVYQSTTLYLVRILYPRESYDFGEDAKGPVRMVC
jgi:hypothetical protein